MATAAAKVRAGEETWDEATLFDFAAFDARPLVRAPFDHIVVPAFLHADALAAVNRDFPPIEGLSNFTPERVTYGPAFAALIDALRGPLFARHFERSSIWTSAAARPPSASAGSARRPTATSTPTTSRS